MVEGWPGWNGRRSMLGIGTSRIGKNWLLGEHGNRLRYFPLLGCHIHRVARTVECLRQDFDRPPRIDGLARDMGLSSSGFHDHFKAITDLSPL